MKKTLFQKLIILLFALPALACAIGGEDPTPTPAPTEAAAVVPTDVPTTDVPPTPTIEVAVEPTVDVTADFVPYTSPETGITVQHPADWAIQDFFVLLIATDETIFDAPGAITEGAGVLFASGPVSEFESTNPVDLVNEAVEQFELSDDATIVEGPTPLLIQGLPAAMVKVEGTPDETGVPLVGLAVVVLNGDRVGIGLGITPQQSENEYLPTFEAMFNTIEVGEPAEDPGISTENPPTLENAVMLSVGDTFGSNLDENGTQDFFFQGTADETVTFTFEPMEDTTDLVVEIFDADLNSIQREDTEFSGESEIVIFTPVATGTYFIRVSDFYGEPGDFNVRAEVGAIEPTETISETLPLEVGQLTPGALTGEPQLYTFNGAAGEPTTILLLPDDWDPTLTILGEDGTILVDEYDEGFTGDPEALTFIPEADGEYTLKVDAFFTNANGNFDLFIFDPENTVSAEGSVPESSFQNYRVCIPANASLIVAVIPVGTLDPVMSLNGPGGGQLIDLVDGGGIGDPEAVLFGDAAGTGAQYPVIISISSYDGASGDFKLFVSTNTTDSVVLDGC